MKNYSITKVYLIVFAVLFFGGIIWSIINGYQYFCDGFKSCDKSGTILNLNDFFERKFLVLLWTAVMSAFITFMLVKDRGEDEDGSD